MLQGFTKVLFLAVLLGNLKNDPKTCQGKGVKEGAVPLSPNQGHCTGQQCHPRKATYPVL